MIRPGQTRLISSSLLTTAPLASISVKSTSKARPPSSIGRPSARTSRRCGKIRKRPNSTPAGASDTGSTKINYSAYFHAFSHFFVRRRGAALRWSDRRREQPDQPSHLYGAGNLRVGAGADFRSAPPPLPGAVVKALMLGFEGPERGRLR